MISVNFDTNQQYTFVVVNIFFNNAMKYMKWSGNMFFSIIINRLCWWRSDGNMQSRALSSKKSSSLSKDKFKTGLKSLNTQCNGNKTFLTFYKIFQSMLRKTSMDLFVSNTELNVSRMTTYYDAIKLTLRSNC